MLLLPGLCWMQQTMKRKGSKKAEFWYVWEPGGYCHTQYDLVRYWCSEFGWDSKGPTSMHPPQTSGIQSGDPSRSGPQDRDRSTWRFKQEMRVLACPGPMVPDASKILNAETTQFTETVIEELFEPWMSLTLNFSATALS